MKTIVWKGPERQLTCYGMAKEGDVKILPDKVADSYVNQGLAEYRDAEPKVPKRSNKKEVN